MITGVNHLTFSVRDLDESAVFCTKALGFRSGSQKDGEAHLLAGGAWAALIPDLSVRDGTLPEHTHIAFSVSAEDFATLDWRIRRYGAEIWQENRAGGGSLYFLDPNGHKLDFHASDLKARIEADKENSSKGMELHD